MSKKNVIESGVFPGAGQKAACNGRWNIGQDAIIGAPWAILMALKVEALPFDPGRDCYAQEMEDYLTPVGVTEGQFSYASWRNRERDISTMVENGEMPERRLCVSMLCQCWP